MKIESDTYFKKRDFIIKKCLEQRTVDTLDRYFVDEYVAEFKVKIKPKNFGADGCPDLRRMLKKLYDQGYLTRWACGLDAGMPGRGFPKWIWSYRLKNEKLWTEYFKNDKPEGANKR